MKGLKDKVIIVTGGAGGIGSATCRRLAEEGAKVAIFDMNIADAEQFAYDINQHNNQALAVQWDSIDRDVVEQSVQQVEGELGRIDGLVNNAGWDIFKPFVKTNPQEWDKLIQINLVGMLNMHFAVLKGMVERNSGSIVNIASDAARVGSS